MSSPVDLSGLQAQISIYGQTQFQAGQAAQSAADQANINAAASQAAAALAQAQVSAQQVADLQAQLAAAQAQGDDLTPHSDYPVLNYTDLAQAGDTLAVVLKQRLPAAAKAKGQPQGWAYLRLPVGFGSDPSHEIVGMVDTGTYGIYAPNCMGIWGSSRNPDDAVIRLRAGSAKATGTMLRLGPQNSSTKVALHCFGWSLEGTPQPGVDWYAGLMDYYGTGSTFEDMKIFGVPAGGNSPPAETFQLNSLHSSGSKFKRVKISGLNRQLHRVGGGAGGNAAVDSYWEDCTFQDAHASGWTFSFAGSAGPSSNCARLTTLRCATIHNANWTIAQGLTFQGLNHEGVDGYIHHQELTVLMTYGAVDAHLGFRNGYQDCPDILVDGIIWSGGPFGPFLTVAVPVAYSGAPDGKNRQVTLPVIRMVKGGPAMTPISAADFKAGKGDPTVNYVLTR